MKRAAAGEEKWLHAVRFEPGESSQPQSVAGCNEDLELMPWQPGDQTIRAVEAGGKVAGAGGHADTLAQRE